MRGAPPKLLEVITPPVAIAGTEDDVEVAVKVTAGNPVALAVTETGPGVLPRVTVTEAFPSGPVVAVGALRDAELEATLKLTVLLGSPAPLPLTNWTPKGLGSVDPTTALWRFPLSIFNWILLSGVSFRIR